MKRLLVLLALVSTPLAASDMDVVRQNVIGYYTGSQADPASPRMADALAGLESQVRDITAPGFLRSDGSWSDINYSETPSGSWSPWDHTRRLLVMAKAYRTPGQAFFGDAQLRSEIESALAYTSVYYGPTKLPSGNWWFWTIGVPLDLGPTLVLMRGDVSQQVYDNCVREIDLRIGSSPTSRGIVGPTPVGENLVWSCFTHLSLGLLKDDASILGQVRDAIASATLPTLTTDGIKPDFSFQQHGPQLYTGGYGGSFANDAAEYALLTRETAYAMPPASLGSLMNYIADGVAWSLDGNYFDVSVIGREVARVSTTGYNGMAALLQASLVPSARQGEIAAAAKMILSTWGALPIELAGLADLAGRSSAAPQWPSGHRHYYMSDYTVHRTSSWFASIKMFSNRTLSGEDTNGENLLGSRQSDGRLYLSLNGNEYFNGSVIPALDWTRLPGITVEQKADTANAAYGFGSNAFAGGTGDGRNGVSAMDLVPLDSSLEAKKSWFFFDDAIVFLTNGITDRSANRVETVVNQWPLADPSAPLVADRDSTGNTRWAWCDRIGYDFPSPAPVQMTKESRSGTWAALGGSTDTTLRSATFATLWLDHGIAPANANAAYVIVPNVTQDGMRAWAAANPLSIDANNGSVSAARDLRSGALGMVFWTAASVDGFSTDGEVLVWMTMEGTSVMHLHVSDAANAGSGFVHLTVPGRFTTSDVRVSDGDYHSTTLEIPRAGGRTVEITLHRYIQGTRHRAMR